VTLNIKSWRIRVWVYQSKKETRPSYHPLLSSCGGGLGNNDFLYVISRVLKVSRRTKKRPRSSVAGSHASHTCLEKRKSAKICIGMCGRAKSVWSFNRWDPRDWAKRWSCGSWSQEVRISYWQKKTLDTRSAENGLASTSAGCGLIAHSKIARSGSVILQGPAPPVRLRWPTPLSPVLCYSISRFVADPPTPRRKLFENASTVR